MRGSFVAAFLAAWILLGCDSSSGDGSGSDAPTVYDVYSYPTYVLTPELESALAYMWHEEKLAGDLYISLNGDFPNAKMSLIATQGEATHQQFIQNLVEKYDLNVTALSDDQSVDVYTLGTGEFAITAIQSLYDSLYDEGNDSAIDALKVGCKVEVVDIDDLNTYIALADGVAQDLEDVFVYLRSGSYKHYWAFDGELKALGVTDGCCAAGATYCHTEYPK